MRILYGVVGEGMGHATRSRVVIEHLLERGQYVHVVASARAHAYLDEAFSRRTHSRGHVTVSEIKGLSILYEDGAVDRLGTVTQNLLAAPSMLSHNMASFVSTLGSFQPELVFSDFDSFAYLYARRAGLPVVSIDNMQTIARCKHPDWAKRGSKVDHQLAKAFVKAKLPKCTRYVVTSFFDAKVRRKCARNTVIIPPVLRREIVDAKATASRKGPVLVYQTSGSNAQPLLDALRQMTTQRFVVYGTGREETLGNCQLRRFHEKTFVRDLAAARAVVQNGGFSLMSEALYLQKPVFSVPVRHQFEQELNARYLERLGLGVRAQGFAELPRFLENLDRFARDGRDVPGLLEEATPNRKLGVVLDAILGARVAAAAGVAAP